jgi:hypothetical protein
MRNFPTLCFIGTLLAFNTAAQNVCEIACTSFSQGRAAIHVKFKLSLNNNVIVEKVSKSGMFQFIMKKDDGKYELEATKEGYVPKIIRLNTENYPFENEYEIQEIDLEFTKESNSVDDVQIGELTWSSVSDEFAVAKIDTALEHMKENYSNSMQKIDQVYVKAIVNGNEMMNIGQPSFAKGYFQIALDVKPDDEYALGKLTEIQMAVAQQREKEKVKMIDEDMMDKINKGELETIENLSSEDNVRFSVQLGAFAKSINMEEFKNVPEFKTIDYKDYKRCFSGEFLDIGEAVKRKKEMVSAGYKDAWIVKLKGNERIGF